MAKVLLVDAAFSAEPIYRALKTQGHQVITVGARQHDPLVAIGGNHRLVDYSDTTALAQIVHSERIDYLVPGCTDQSYSSCVKLNHESRFPGLDSAEAHATLHDKERFRRFAQEKGLSAPRLCNLDTVSGDKPIIVKPVDSFSGKGITHLPSPTRSEAESAYEYASSFSRSGRALIEEFVEGQLYSHSAFIQSGKIVKDYIVEEHCSATPFAVDISHLSHDFPKSILGRLRTEIGILCQELKLKDGLLHTQLIQRNDSFWLIEITRRCPGDLYSQLISLSGASNYAHDYASAFTNESFKKSGQITWKYILRHTISTPASTPFYWVDYPEAVPLRALIPLSYPGERYHEQTKRAAIAFYECDSNKQIANLKNTVAANTQEYWQRS